MKKWLLMIALATVSLPAWTQSAPYKVVFDITTGDTTMHQTVIRWAQGITRDHPGASVEIVFYGKALEMVTRGKSVVAGDVLQLASGNKVQFTVCEAAMKRNNVQKSQLLEGVGTVPDGIYQIIKRQQEGWGYIKATR